MKSTKMQYTLLSGLIALMSFASPLTAMAASNKQVQLDVGDKIPQTALITLPTLDKDVTKNLKVKWEVGDENIAKMSFKNELVGVSAGTTHVKAYVEGHPETSYEFDAVVKSTVTGIKLNTPQLQMTLGEKTILDAEVVPANATDTNIKSVSSNSKIVSVNSKGQLTATGIGTATITSKTEDGGYTAVTKVIVTSPVTNMTLGSSMSVEVGKNQEIPLELQVSTENKQTLAYDIDNEDVVKISNKGIATGLKEGKTNVKVSTLDGKFNKTIQINVVSNVDELYIVDEDSNAISNLNLEVGQAFKIYPTNDPYSVKALEKYKPEITSSDKSILTVTGTTLKAKKEGAVKVTVKLPQETSKTIEKSFVVHVKPGITKITLDQNDLSLQVGGSETLTASMDDKAVVQKLTWSSEDNKIAKVNNGKVTGVAPGTTVIHATSPDGKIVADCTVSVEGIVSDIDAPDLVKVYIGETYSFTPVAIPNDALVKTILFSQEKADKELLKVSKNTKGEYTLVGVKAGIVNLKLYSKDGNITKTVQVQVMNTDLSICLLDEYGKPIK